MLKKFSIIVFILISITLIFMSTQKKLVPQIDMLTISGETISTKDLKGSVYLVNFWATDCPGCIEEMPGLIDTFNKYKNKNKLSAEFLGRGGAWLDTGSIDDFYKTSSFVSALENRQGLKIACLEEIALSYNWIKKKDIKEAISFYGICLYSNYLKKLI